MLKLIGEIATGSFFGLSEGANPLLFELAKFVFEGIIENQIFEFDLDSAEDGWFELEVENNLFAK